MSWQCLNSGVSGTTWYYLCASYRQYTVYGISMFTLPLSYTPSLNATSENQLLSIPWWIETVRLSGCHDSALILESQVLLGTTCVHCIDRTLCVVSVCSLCLCPTHHHSMPLQKINCYLYHDGLKLLDWVDVMTVPWFWSLRYYLCALYTQY